MLLTCGLEFRNSEAATTFELDLARIVGFHYILKSQDWQT